MNSSVHSHTTKTDFIIYYQTSKHKIRNTKLKLYEIIYIYIYIVKLATVVEGD